MKYIISSKRRAALAQRQAAQGYGIERRLWAGTRMTAYWVSIRVGGAPGAEQLKYEMVGRVDSGTCSWIEISPNGIHIAGPGHSGGYRYPMTDAGIEQARHDVLLHHVAHQLLAANACPDSNSVARAAIAGALSAT